MYQNLFQLLRKYHHLDRSTDKGKKFLPLKSPSLFFFEKRSNTENGRVASLESVSIHLSVFNPSALRKAKIVSNFGLSECNRVKLLPLDFLF